ncbi:MAG TPA: histidine phosphatase family protein [Flavitalea sp.]|nr:histidine phosphatase family protein [Flavitalea sp.]
MKTVLLVRHAKSSWESFSVKDIDRPLNERGKKNAPEMAERLRSKGFPIDAFLSSPAKRAKKTALIFAKNFGRKKEDVIEVPSLYEANLEDFEQAIAEAPAEATSIAIFSHNPGITEFVNALTEVRIDNMPTSAVFAVKADISQWGDFKNAQKEFLFFDYPKSTSTQDRALTSS